jgi:Uma2 family endonuclease
VTALPSWPGELLDVPGWDALADVPGHRVELVEGVLLVVPSPGPLHQRAAYRLVRRLEDALPDELAVVGDVDVLLGPPAAPPTVRRPDAVVVPNLRAEAEPRRFRADEVLLALEVVSPGTGRTDRVTKLAEYAEAGIGGYWLVELGPPVRLIEHRLGADGHYDAVQEQAGGAVRVGVGLLGPDGVLVDLDRLTSRRP